MNPTLKVINSRKSVRAYQDQAIPVEAKQKIIHAAMRAPTAGNLMLYTILDITDQAIKEKLSVTCDHQPFIARAPMVLIFLADYQRIYDYFNLCAVPEMCRETGHPLRTPAEGDLFLACCDALIAAQNAVIAAASLGIGSCYIGDIMENYETHRELLDLPDYVFPVTMVCFGYPTEQQKQRTPTGRFEQKYIVFKNRYRRLNQDEFAAMFQDRVESIPARKQTGYPQNTGQQLYLRKFASAFSREMTRSVKQALRPWMSRGRRI